MVSTGHASDTAGSPSLTRSPLEQLHHLLVSLLCWWPYAPHKRIPSILLAAPTLNGKSHLVFSAAAAANACPDAAEGEVACLPERDGDQAALCPGPAEVTAASAQSSALSQAPGRTYVVTVIPPLAKALAAQNARDGSTGLRRLLRRAIHDACVTYCSQRSTTSCLAKDKSSTSPPTDICILLVLDHMECYLQQDDTYIPGSGSLGELSREGYSAQGINTPYPAFLGDLYTVLHSSPPLFSQQECAALHLARLVAVCLFTGGLDEVLPVVRHRYVDYAVALPTPTEAARRAFFLQYATPAADGQAPLRLPFPMVDALTLRTGGISYGGLQEVLGHALDYCASSLHSLSSSSPDLLGDVKCDKHVASAMAQTIVQTYQTSGSVTALEYRRSAGFVDIQVTRWDDIAGMAHVKETLQRLVTDPIRHRTTYQHFRVRPSTGVLLYGPPGTGKTMLARAMATELNASFVYMDIPKLVQAEVGESERRLQEYFDVARERSPSLVFMDEVQAAFGLRYANPEDAHPHRTRPVASENGDLGRVASAPGTATAHDARLVSHLLRLLDAAQQDEEHFVLFVGATNVVHLLDPLLLRAGRLDTLLEVPLPDAAARESLVRRVVYGEWAHWFCEQQSDTCLSCPNAVNGAVPPPNSAERLEDLRSALVEAFVRHSDGFSGAEVRNLMSVFGLQLARIVSRKLDATQGTALEEPIDCTVATHDPRVEQHKRQLRLGSAITAFLSNSGGAGRGLGSDALALLDAVLKKPIA